MRAVTLFTLVLAAISLATNTNGQWSQVVGNSGVNGQMMFSHAVGQVAILDKVENNPMKRPNSNAPAFAVFYSTDSNTARPVEVRSNTFCAGGGMLGDGRWIVTGGNKAVGTGGVTDNANTSPYYAYSGGRALRFLAPCSGNNCQWDDNRSNKMIKERWYPTVETMRDGYAMIIGGMRDGGFTSTAGSNEGTYEFYPSTGTTYDLPLLTRSLPVALYPFAYLMADNRVFLLAKRNAILWNTDTLKETPLDQIPGTPRNYPNSGGSTMLPMTPANNYRQEVIFCGGQSLGKSSNYGNEGGPTVMVSQKPASTNCATITPLTTSKWTVVDSLPEGRSMGQFVNLPDGRLWFAMGVKTGMAAYITDPNSPSKPVGMSLGDNPSQKVFMYDPVKPAGSRWSPAGDISVPRLYHSSATLLPDSSILMSGSNPNPDVTTNQKFNTEYRVERWYPSYYNQPRPSNYGLPSIFAYGGAGFSLQMNSAKEARGTKVVIIRTGFSTHGVSFGQRHIELRTAVHGKTVKVAAMPPNPALFQPGIALAFVVVNGVPSHGKFVMVGNGKIGKQPIGPETNLNKRDLESRQTSPLSKAEVDHATSIADLLNAAPTNDFAGQTLSSAPEDLKGHLDQGIQQQVDSILGDLLSGARTDHLAGRRKRNHSI